MSYIPDALRQLVIERAKGYCEYCRIPQQYSLYIHEVDHIIAEKHRGKTHEDNLCLACLECNRHKGSDFGSFDPDTDEVTMFFNPRKHIWEAHFKLDGGYIIPLSPIGRVTVFILKFNDEIRVRTRLALIHAGHYPPK